MRTVALTDQDEMEWVKAHPKAFRISTAFIVAGAEVYYWVDASELNKVWKICVPLRYAHLIGTRPIPVGLTRVFEVAIGYYLQSGVDVVIQHTH